jgi:hypothetical protein
MSVYTLIVFTITISCSIYLIAMGLSDLISNNIKKELHK